MDAVALARKLVSIPSYVDRRTNECQVAEFIAGFLGELGYLRVQRQPVEKKRFNIIAHDDHPPRLMFCCHMDTVQPSGSWEHPPFGGEVERGRLYGLGAVDMKGGTACLLDALQAFKDSGTRGLYLLFDVDEEYAFKGMKRFIAEHEVHPDLVVLPEPGFVIRNGHRGALQVLHLRVRGRSAHASRPRQGKNAILGTTAAVEHLIRQLRQYDDPVLGSSTCNLAALRGGIAKEEAGQIEITATSPNKIPDIAEAVLDIRPASARLRGETVERILRDYLSARGYTVEAVDIPIEHGSLFVPAEHLEPFVSAVSGVLGAVKYGDLRQFGYGEGQMLNERLGVPCVYFGPGPIRKAHQPDEYVSVSNLPKIRAVFASLIERYCAPATTVAAPEAARKAARKTRSQ